MECFVSHCRLVAFEDNSNPATGSLPLGYGLSQLSTEPGIDRKNCWLMIDGQIRPTRVATAGVKIALGVARKFNERTGAGRIQPGDHITRAEFLCEMRQLEDELRRDPCRDSSWVEANLAAFDHKPNLNVNRPPRPPAPPQIRNIQIDTGTIGISISTPSGIERVGEVHVSGGLNGAYHEIWVIKNSYAMHMPPGTNTAPRSVELCESELFEATETVTDQRFLDSAWGHLGPDASVFLIEALQTEGVPAV